METWLLVDSNCLSSERSHYRARAILLVKFNEEFVIECSLEAMKYFDHLRDNVEVAANDSNDETIPAVDKKSARLESLRGQCIRFSVGDQGEPKCAALNNAVQIERSDYVFLFDSDSVIPLDILNKCFNVIEYLS